MIYRQRPCDIFRISDRLRCEGRELPENGGEYLVCDEFYANPQAVRQLVLAAPYPIWINTHGSSHDFVHCHDCRQTILVPFFKPQHAFAELAQRYLDIDAQEGRHDFTTNAWKLDSERPAHRQPFPHDDAITCAARVMLNTPVECAALRSIAARPHG